MSDIVAQADGAELVRQWERSVPWWRRMLVRSGLQGKLVAAFLMVLFVALGGSVWLVVSSSRKAMAGVMGEQAVQLSVTLSLASKSALGEGNRDELDRMGRDLLKSRNIVFVGFYDPRGQALAMACRDPDFDGAPAHGLATDAQSMQRLMQVQPVSSAVLGDYLQVAAPVVAANTQGTRLVGYVAVGVSQAREQSQISRASYLGMALGCIIFLLSLPLVTGLVHRILLPIRQLVAAANRIARGDYHAKVAVHRPDEIGVLARAFNEMVAQVRAQQQQLQDANRQLENKVAERTAELQASNQRLSSEIAEKEDFLRAVSHDLNAPLRNIGGMASMLLMKYREKLDEDIVHRLQRIQKNVEVETDLITELLELSRIKTRRQKPEAVDLDELVRDVGGVFEEDLRRGGIALEIDGRLPTLVCEKARLRQVFQNLIDNAIKYMGEGPERRIRVSCRHTAAAVELAVADTGMGIDAEDLPRVFNVFRRGRNSAGKAIAGKGVGLSSVKSIIENYQGRIWVESQVGQGSTFRFVIPRAHVLEAGRGDCRPDPLAPAA